MRANKRARTALFPQRPRSTRRAAAAGWARSAVIPPQVPGGSGSKNPGSADAEQPAPLPPASPAPVESVSPARDSCANPSADHSRADHGGTGSAEYGEDDSPLSLLSDDSLALALSRLPTRFALTSLAFVCRRWRRLALHHCVRELRPSPLTLRATGCFASADAVTDLVRRFSSSLRAIELRPPAPSAGGNRGSGKQGRRGGGRGKGKCVAEGSGGGAADGGNGAEQSAVGEIVRNAPMLEELTIMSCFAGEEGDDTPAAAPLVPAAAPVDSTLSVIISSAASTNTTASGPAAACGGSASAASSNAGSSTGIASGSGNGNGNGNVRGSGSGRSSSKSTASGGGLKQKGSEASRLDVPMRPLAFVLHVLPHLPRSLTALSLPANHFLSPGSCLPAAGGREGGEEGGQGGQGGQRDGAWGQGNPGTAGRRGDGRGIGEEGEEQGGGGEGGEGVVGGASERALPLPHHSTPHDSFLYALTSSLPSLHTLNLDTPSSLSSSAVLHLPLSLPRLTSLSLYSNAIAWPTVFSLLALTPSLRHLSLVSSALTSTDRPRRPPFPSSASPTPDAFSSLHSSTFPAFPFPAAATTATITTPSSSSSRAFSSTVLSSLPSSIPPLSSLRLYTSPHRSVQWDLPPAHSLLHALLSLPPPATARPPTVTPIAPPPTTPITTTSTAATAPLSAAATGRLWIVGSTEASGSTGASGASGSARAPGPIMATSASPLRSLHAQHTFSASWQTIGVCCHALTELDLSFPPRPFSPSTTWGAAAAGSEGLTGIEEIVLCGTLSLLPRLRRLALPAANDQVLRHVAHCCPLLSTLLSQPHILATSPGSSLPRCPPQPQVTDDGIRALAHGCPGLVQLSLAGCVRVGSGVRQLAYHCQQLRVLRLEGSGVDDRAVLGALFGGAWKWHGAAAHSTAAASSGAAAGGGGGTGGGGGSVQLVLPKLVLLDLWGCAAVTSELLLAILHAAMELAAAATLAAPTATAGAATAANGVKAMGKEKQQVVFEAPAPASSEPKERTRGGHVKLGGGSMQEGKGEEAGYRSNGQPLQLRRLMVSPSVLKGSKGNGKGGVRRKGADVSVDVSAVLQQLKEELPLLLVSCGRTAKELLPWDGFIHLGEPWEP